MFVLSALLVLLPLAASALDSCDPVKVAAVLGKPQLTGFLLDNLADKRFWVVAARTEDVGTTQSVEVNFGSQTTNTVPLQLVFFDSNGSNLTISGSYTLKGDHISTSTCSVYLFRCSPNLIAGYRCENEGEEGGLGPVYFAWTDEATTEAAISGEVDSCLAQYASVDSAATFSRLAKP